MLHAQSESEKYRIKKEELVGLFQNNMSYSSALLKHISQHEIVMVNEIRHDISYMVQNEGKIITLAFKKGLHSGVIEILFNFLKKTNRIIGQLRRSLELKKMHF